MSDGDLLLAAILAHPGEDVPRLAYADWLDEQGEHERAEFIRVQCEIARVGAHEERPHTPEMDAALMRLAELRRRERGLLELHGWQRWQGACAAVIPKGAHTPSCIEFRRGFIERVTCSAADWLAHGDAVLAAHPVRAVTLTTPLHLDVGGDSFRLWSGGIDRAYAAGVRAFIDERMATSGQNLFLDDLQIALKLAWRGVAFTLPPAGAPAADSFGDAVGSHVG